MRTSVTAILLLLGATFTASAHADVGPPPRSDCALGGTRCWIEGKIEGTCVDGICRRVVPSASAIPSAAASATPSAAPGGGSGCAVLPSARAADGWLAGLALVAAVFLGRNLRRRR